MQGPKGQDKPVGARAETVQQAGALHAEDIKGDLDQLVATVQTFMRMSGEASMQYRTLSSALGIRMKDLHEVLKSRPDIFKKTNTHPGDQRVGFCAPSHYVCICLFAGCVYNLTIASLLIHKSSLLMLFQTRGVIRSPVFMFCSGQGYPAEQKG